MLPASPAAVKEARRSSHPRGFEPDPWRHWIGAGLFFYESNEGERIVILIAASHRGSAY